MEFTPDQEQKLIEENMPKIYRAVDNFMARCSSRVICIPYEDFVQEVAISFIEYVRKCKSHDDLAKFPWFDAMNAMRNYVLINQPLSCPRHPNKFSDIIHEMPQTMSSDSISAKTCIDIDGMGKHWVEDKETQMDFDIFMNDQNENIQRIASMRVYGMTLKEIGDQCGVSKVAIKKRLNKLNDAYKKYAEDAKDA